MENTERDGVETQARGLGWGDSQSEHRECVHPQTTHKRTAWWNDLIARWKQWFESSFTKTPKIVTNGWNPFCSLCGRSRKPPQGFPPSSSCMGVSPVGCWMAWERCGRRDLRKAKMKFSMCWTWEQNSTPWGSSPWRICYRPRTSRAGCTIGGLDYAILHREIKYLYYSPLLALMTFWGHTAGRRSQLWGGSNGPERGTSNLPSQPPEKVERGGAGDAGDGGEWRGWSREVNTKIPSLTLAPGGDHLSPSQLTDVARLQTEFADVFSPRPGRTDLIQHHIETEPGVVMRSRPYRLPEHKKKVVQSELEAMLEMRVIEESHSDWASPIVLVPKTDGSVRFCVDYRKVNAVSKFNAYPMPRVDELLDRLGTALIYSTLDLTKRYWQIPLSPLSKEKTAFTMPFGLHQFVTHPFGLSGRPTLFSG